MGGKGGGRGGEKRKRRKGERKKKMRRGKNYIVQSRKKEKIQNFSIPVLLQLLQNVYQMKA